MEFHIFLFECEELMFFALLIFQNCRYSKLEKADILEMTVRFLRDLPSTPVKSKFILTTLFKNTLVYIF